MPRTRFPATARANARRHIEEHARAEPARIVRLSRVREFVLGAQDGLLVPLGVVTLGEILSDSRDSSSA
jgi:hypothetical protein